MRIDVKRSALLRRTISLLVFLFISLFGLFSTTATTHNVGNFIVNSQNGKIKGAQRATGGAEFLGIPYAQAPVGNLRWREPSPLKKWSGVRDTTKFGAPCAQPILGDWNRHDSDTSSEDCLFLNVITPEWPVKSPLPVMFWIHGGANAGGTASSNLYKDGTLVNHGVILVTINYRLGIFGFLSHPELTRESSHKSSGNYGLMDQIAALRWVHDNIAKFGGDPGNITVFGQSAGAQDTSLLMTSPLAKELFHRAIVQSGSVVNPPCPTLMESEQAGVKIAEVLKATGNGAIKALRQLPTEELLKSTEAQDPTQPPLIGPNIDGWVISQAPSKVFSNGQQAPIPLLIGTTTREFGFSGSLTAVRKFIQNVTGDLADRALSLYGLAEDGQGIADDFYGSAGDQWFADFVFRCPVRAQVTWHTTHDQTAYQYEFSHAIPGQEAAIHSSELPYVFGFYPKSGSLSANFAETDFRLADLVETYWTNFARNGNPNAAGLPSWPRFDSSESFIRFMQDGSVKVLSGGLRRRHCDLLLKVLKPPTN